MYVRDGRGVVTAPGGTTLWLGHSLRSTAPWHPALKRPRLEAAVSLLGCHAKPFLLFRPQTLSELPGPPETFLPSSKPSSSSSSSSNIHLPRENRGLNGCLNQASKAAHEVLADLHQRCGGCKEFQAPGRGWGRLCTQRLSWGWACSLFSEHQLPGLIHWHPGFPEKEGRG